jgi:hypothetical protein
MRFTGMGCQRCDSPDQLWVASSGSRSVSSLSASWDFWNTTKRLVIPATFAARAIRSSSKNFLVSSLGETVSAYDWRDRIGDFCIAEYLAGLDTVHVVRYSTRFSLTCAARVHAFPISDNHGEKMLSASATERALASFMTSDGTQIGKRSYLDWRAPPAVCSSHTLASCFSRNREPSLTRLATDGASIAERCARFSTGAMHPHQN